MKKLKKWMQFNKPAVIWIGIIIIYTMIMGGIIIFLGDDLDNCSSGSLTSNDSNVQIETSIGGSSSAGELE